MLWLVFLAVALANSPSGGYAPGPVECPNEPLLRSGNSLSSREIDWVQKREEVTSEALHEFLEAHLKETDFSNVTSRLATTIGGGGFRAMLVGAGNLAAIDSRSAGAADSPVSGLLQSSTYLAGVSGSAWLVGSVALQDYATIDSLLDPGPNSNMWNLESDNSLIDFSNIFSLAWAFLINSYSTLITNVRWWNTPAGEGISSQIAAKEKAGFPTTVTDVWGRDLAHSLYPSEDNYFSSAVWSDIATMPSFQNHLMPFPFVTSLARRPDSLTFDLDSPVVEFNPFETGSFDTSINSFFLTKYSGSDPSASSKATSQLAISNSSTNDAKSWNSTTRLGSSSSTSNNSSNLGLNFSNSSKLAASSSGKCIAGYDNAAYVIGVSSSLFNEFLNYLVCPNCNALPGLLKWFARRMLLRMSSQKEDIAIVKPNPFYGSPYAASDNISTSESLYLMDGGLGGEVLPLSTLMNVHRKVDTILAFDQFPAWPDGSTLVDAYRRSDLYEGKDMVCPYVPGEDTFAAFNLTAKPVFFGCDASNQTDRMKNGVVPPLVIYMANRPFEYYSNQSTYQLTYSDSEKKATVQNGFDVASQMNGTVDANWGTCVACALIRRDQERKNEPQSDECKRCFERYCWDGSVYEGPEPYYPPVNYTLTGLTNDSMSLWGDHRIVVTDSSSDSFSILGWLWDIIKSWF